MAYVSDDQVTINTQGLRTVRREDRPWAAPGSQWILDWSYKGQENFYRYADKAARDAMYEALRKALTESKQQKQPGNYDMQRAIRMVESITRSGRAWTSATLVEALEPIMRPRVSQGEGDADNPK